MLMTIYKVLLICGTIDIPGIAIEKKEKQKRMERNKQEYKRRNGKYNDKRIERKMRKCHGNFKILLC